MHVRLRNPATGHIWFLSELWFNDYAFKDSHTFDVEAWIKPFGVYVLAAIVPIALPSWHHFCLDLNFESGEVSVLQNGELITANGTAMLVEMMVNSTQQLVASRGEQGGLYLWINNEVVSLVDIFTGEVSPTACGQGGDYLSWQLADWGLTGSGERQQEDEASHLRRQSQSESLEEVSSRRYK